MGFRNVKIINIASVVWVEWEGDWSRFKKLLEEHLKTKYNKQYIWVVATFLHLSAGYINNVQSWKIVLKHKDLIY